MIIDLTKDPRPQWPVHEGECLQAFKEQREYQGVPPLLIVDPPYAAVRRDGPPYTNLSSGCPFCGRNIQAGEQHYACCVLYQ